MGQRRRAGDGANSPVTTPRPRHPLPIDVGSLPNPPPATAHAAGQQIRQTSATGVYPSGPGMATRQRSGAAMSCTRAARMGIGLGTARQGGAGADRSRCRPRREAEEDTEVGGPKSVGQDDARETRTGDCGTATAASYPSTIFIAIRS